jgi:hypothetical protein
MGDPTMPLYWSMIAALSITLAIGTLPKAALAQTAPHADAATLAALDLLEVMGASKQLELEKQQMVRAIAKTAALRDGGTKVEPWRERCSGQVCCI